MRDRTRTRAGQLLYGGFALGWRGSAVHWSRLQTVHTTMAALGVPLVCSVHSIVGLDFAASLMPGWQESIFPPYFVVGAMYCGFAMVVVLALAFRWGLNLQAIITRQHFEVMARIC
jgi:Polysulphide reductase